MHNETMRSRFYGVEHELRGGRWCPQFGKEQTTEILKNYLRSGRCGTVFSAAARRLRGGRA